MVKNYEMKENESSTTTPTTTTLTKITTTTTTTQTTTTEGIADINLDLLPPLVIGHLALFLSRSSRALLGAALAPSVQCNWTNDDWKILDFSDLDKDLAAKLTDDDLYHVLKWIDATKKRLKILKLTGCVNIIGHGLRILHGAINLRQIDLSLVGKNEPPTIEPEPALSQAVLLPILSSMIKSKHIYIRHIQMPKHWRIIDNNPELNQFFALYSKRLSSHYNCSQCDDRICRGGKRKKWMNENGIQKFTCYECMDSFCTQCVKEYSPDCDVKMCGNCEKFLCDECGPVMTCSQCSEMACDDCKPMDICDDCNKVFCEDCGPVFTCSRCKETSCDDCNPMGFCDECNNIFCDNCVPTGCCDVCNRILCSECCPVSYCDGQGCLKATCMDCLPIGMCDDCNKCLCDECCPVNYCEGEGCRKATCMDCATPTQNVWWCNVCEHTFCPDCRLDEYRKNKDAFCLNCRGTIAFSG